MAAHSSQNELHALASFPLPKMSYMLLIFPPSRRELINSVACALGVREKRELNRRLNSYKHEGSRGLREEEEEANWEQTIDAWPRNFTPTVMERTKLKGGTKNEAEWET